MSNTSKKPGVQGVGGSHTGIYQERHTDDDTRTIYLNDSLRNI